MIYLLSFLLLPFIGIIALMVNTFLKCRMKEEKIVGVVIAGTVAIFFGGLALGFKGISIDLVSKIGFSFSLGINSLSLPFMLIAVIIPGALLYTAYKEIKDNKAFFYILYLITYASLISVFISYNFILLFIFWEAAVLSLFFIISFWGDKDTGRASGMKFLVFTQLSSLALLAVILLLFSYTGSFSLYSILQLASSIPLLIQYVILFFLLVTVMIKMPLFPLHAWMPDSYLSAPTTGTVLLSSLLSKLGVYAFLLIGFEMIPAAILHARIILIGIGLLTVLYIAVVATSQRNLKKLFSYSSMIYMAMIFIGISSLTTAGADGAIVLTVSHSFIIAMLFILTGTLKSRSGSYEISSMGGYGAKMPALSVFFVFAVLAVMGVPGLSNFVGEFLVFFGAYSVLPIALIGLIGVIISTNYYLSAIKNVIFGRLSRAGLRDIGKLETLQMLLLSSFVVLVGVLPNLIISMSRGLI